MKEKVEATFGGGLKFIWQGSPLIMLSDGEGKIRYSNILYPVCSPSIFSSFDTDTMVIEGNFFRTSNATVSDFA
jgi:hypothetical protein